eukprot:03481.XXX_86927_87610_1 [CDS] Oithona nana genome sequencing.
MRDFQLKLIETNEISDEDYTFKLDEKATVLDLKEAFTKKEGYNPDELRLIYQRQEGDEPLEDTELLEDIEKHPGVFLLEVPTLGTPGNVSIFRKFSEALEGEQICLLIGSKKKFQHHLLNHEKNNFSIPSLKFPWAQNKLAVIEDDKEYEYEAVQYSIKNHWELEIRKNHMGNTKWLVLKKRSDGRWLPLFGKPTTFSVANEMFPRTYE